MLKEILRVGGVGLNFKTQKVFTMTSVLFVSPRAFFPPFFIVPFFADIGKSVFIEHACTFGVIISMPINYCVAMTSRAVISKFAVMQVSLLPLWIATMFAFSSEGDRENV